MNTQHSEYLFFPSLDHSETEKAIKAYQGYINGALRASEPESYGKKAIKKNHIQLMLRLKDMYAAYLKESKKQRSYSRVFWVTVTGLSRDLNCDRSTIHRNLERLIDQGFLKRSFHGNNCGIRIRFNEELMVCAAAPEFVLQAVDNAENTGEKQVALRPQLRYYFASSVAKCNHNVTSNLPFKFKSEIAELCISPESNPEIQLSLAKAMAGEIHNKPESTGKPFTGNTPSIKTPIGVSKQETQVAAGPDQKIETIKRKIADTGKISSIDLNVMLAMRTILNLLYPNRWFSEYKLSQAKAYLWEYFAENTSEIGKLQEALTQRVVLARYFVQQRADRYIPDIDKWLDPTFEYGFSGTQAWKKQADQWHAQNKLLNDNRKQLARLINKYYFNPSLEQYQAGAKELSRKKDDNLVVLYNKCIMDKSEFTHKNLRNALIPNTLKTTLNIN